jgi:2-iminobutanoate/2-iminopropanoate deaminase
MQRHTIYAKEVAKPFGVFSQAVKWSNEYENLIFVSGMTSRDANGKTIGIGDIRAQTIQTLENLKAVLKEAGATLEDVVRVTIYVTDMSNLDEIHEIRAQYWRKNYPASTLVEVSKFVNKDFLIEIEATAITRSRA